MILFLVVGFSGCTDTGNERVNPEVKISYDYGKYFPSSEILFYIDCNDTGTIVNNTINWGDGTVDYYSTIINEVTHQYNDSGEYQVVLTVKNDAGLSDSYAIIVKIDETSNKPPIVRIYEPDPSSGNAPLVVSFSSNSSDLDGTIVTWEWDFGDGHNTIFTNELDKENPTYTYDIPGEYLITVTVTDNDGATDSDWCYITVNR